MTLKEQLIRDEGIRLKPYKDTLGKLTIGVGRNLDDKGITREEAMTLLWNDIAECEAQIEKRLPWAKELDFVRYCVLVNMCFNMGIGDLISKNPKGLAAMEAGDYALAAREMLDGNWKEQVGDRAYRLARQMETGEWQ